MHSFLASGSCRRIAAAPQPIKNGATQPMERLSSKKFKITASNVGSADQTLLTAQVDQRTKRVTSVAEMGQDAFPNTEKHSIHDTVEFLVKEFTGISNQALDDLVFTLKKNIDDLVKERSADGVPSRWSYVPILPVDRVSGKCLSLDFGCNDNFFQVAVCNIQESGSRTDSEEFHPIDRRAFVLTSAIRHAHMSAYSDFVAICVRKVMQDNGLLNQTQEPIYMGIVAGFDARLKLQFSPAEAKVPQTYKDYKMGGFIGCDFVASFQQAMDKHGLQVQIVTVLNDTVCTMLSGVHKIYARRQARSDCSIGVVSTRSGANVTFLETDQDFLDSCTTDRRLLLRSPRGNGFCLVVNPEIGMHGGEKGELNRFINNVERNVLESCSGETLRWECLSSGYWYYRLLRSSIGTLRALKAVGETFPEGLTPTNCFEVFSLCDNFWNESITKTGLTKQLQALLDPNESHKILLDEAEVLARICRAIVGRSAIMLASCIMAVAYRVYGKAFPEQMVVAYSGAMFQIRQLLPALQERLDSFASPINSLYPFNIELVPTDIAFGCAVSAITIGQTLRKNDS